MLSTRPTLSKRFWLFLAAAWLMLLVGCAQGSATVATSAANPAALIRPTATGGGNGAPLRTLTVTSTGEVALTPDLAQVTLAVETRNRDLGKALSENNQRTAQVIHALQQGGVAEKDIHTSNFAVSQERHYDKEGNLILGPYTVTNSLVVTVRDLEQLGALLDAAPQADANRMDNLTFGSSQAKEAQLQAKLAAVEEAQKQAQAIAQQAGVTLEGVQTITFGYATPVQATAYRAEKLAAAQAEVPVAPGEMKVTATVTIVFLIR